MKNFLSILFNPTNTVLAPFLFLKYIGFNGLKNLFVTSKSIKKLCENSVTFKWFKEKFNNLKDDEEEEQLEDLKLFIKDFYIREDSFKKFKEGRNMFVTGGAGTGKTHLVNSLMNSTEKPFLNTSTTAVSAIDFSGRTIDSSLLPIMVTDKCFYCEKTQRLITLEEAVSNMCKFILSRLNFYEEKVQAILNAQILRIDEVSMLSKFRMDFYSECLKVIRSNSKPFGGLQIILSGDFFQFQPIGTTLRGTKIESTYQYAFESKAWKELDLICIELKYGHRQKDKEYMNILNRIRVGNPSNSDITYLKRRIKKTNRDDAVKIYPITVKVNEENQRCLDKLKTDLIEFNMKVYKFGAVSNEFVNAFKKESNLSEIIQLKVGCRIMITRNIDLKNGLCNGVIGIFKGRSSKSKNEILIEISTGVIKYIPLCSFQRKESHGNIVSIEQFPVVLAHAITGHKSQGSTIKGVISVDCGNSVFSKHQIYVMLSRVEKGENVYIMNFDPSKIKVDEKVKKFYNLVEEEIDSNDISVEDFNKSLLEWKEKVEFITKKVTSSVLNEKTSVGGIQIKKFKNEKE
jgi:hypothetical protein